MKTAIVALGLGAALLTVAPTLVLAAETDTAVGAFKALTGVSAPVQLEDKELAAIEGGTDVHYDFAQNQSVIVGIVNHNTNENTNVASATANATGGSIAIEVLPINIELLLPVGLF